MTFTQACWRSAVSVLALGVASLGPASANPTVVVDAGSGEVLYKDMATAPWFPASTTKLMTVYVALSKVREGKISLDTPLRVSSYAASMIPSKMGFRPGTLVTLDNALKMLMVKSPNDIAVTIADHRDVRNLRSHGMLYGLDATGEAALQFTFGAYGRLLSSTVHPEQFDPAR